MTLLSQNAFDFPVAPACAFRVEASSIDEAYLVSACFLVTNHTS